ncbi:hypothetical protein [uncultured Winogradskyella sp.]|uniref:hypothetical protein n=1 Tax=uncultured Winogradskyella sp. TaxID=395353 RepID=UPI002620EF3E|nr:hypothetical protein [uncultured Winogradskyella sp.]
MQDIQNILSNKKRIKLIVIFYHLLFSLFTLYYTINFHHESDAERIFRMANNADNWSSLWGLGTVFNSFLIYPLIKIGFNYVMLTILFSLISLKGYLVYVDLFFETNTHKTKNQLLLLLLLLALPSYHYWTSFIGKDVIVFYLMAIVLSGVIKKKYITIPFILAALLVLLIRPYLLIILMFAYSISFLFNSRFTANKKIKYFIIFTAFVLLCIPVLKKFLRIDNFNLESIKEGYQNIIVYSQNNGDSSIDLQNSNYLERMFLVLFRPFFYDFKTLLHFLASIENLTVWVILSKVLFKIRSTDLTTLKKVIFPVIVSVSLVAFYSIYMYNLGLASRMRVMFMPYIIFSLFWIIEENKKIT